MNEIYEVTEFGPGMGDGVRLLTAERLVEFLQQMAVSGMSVGEGFKVRRIG